jgi:DNA-binding MarR family transcriptional regulator
MQPLSPDGSPVHTYSRLGPVSPQALTAAGVTADVVDLADAFLELMHRMRDHLHAVAELHGLTLRLLHTPRAQREIAAHIGCDPSYVTGIVDRLEEIGAVERTADPTDRRVKRIVLTELGDELRRDVVIGLLQGVPIAAGLDATARQELLQLLGRTLVPNVELNRTTTP